MPHEMSGEPRILAGFVHGTLEVIDAQGGDLGARVRAELKPDTLEAIQNAWSAAWVPVALDVELSLAFCRVAGAEEASEAMRRNMAEAFHKPMLRAVIDGAVRILGLSPGKLVRWAPRIWPLVMKDAGVMRVASEKEGEATVWLEGLPPLIADERDYLMGTASAIAAVFDLAGTAGDCRLVEHGQGRARFHLRW